MVARLTILVLALTAPVAADEHQELARAFASAQFRSSEYEAVRFAVRSASLHSEGVLDALRAGTVLEDIARLTLRKRAWVLGAELEPGTYRFGMEKLGDDFRFVVRDKEGRRRATDRFWISVPSGRIAKPSVLGGNGDYSFGYATGGIEFSWSAVTVARHDAIVAGLREFKSGRVSVHSDVAQPGIAEALAAEADRSLAVHARVLGRTLDKERRFRVYLIANKRAYEATSDLVADGDFKDRLGFTAHINNRAYVRFAPLHRLGLALSGGPPLQLRAVMLHEIHHIVAELLYPKMSYTWPLWLKEGLAEWGTYETMRLHAPEDAKRFERQVLGTCYDAALRGAPHFEDLMAGRTEVGVRAYYAAAFRICRQMARRPEQLHGLLEIVTSQTREERGATVARAELMMRYGKAFDSIRPAPALPVVTHGFADWSDDRVRVVSEAESQARVVYPEVIPGDSVRLETSFAWGDLGQKQADLYLGYSTGRYATQFLKVAVMPGRITLFRFRHGEWTTIGKVEYKSNLAVGTDVWHPLTVHYDGEKRRLRAETTGGRWAEFDCKDYIPMIGTRYGVGTYHGLVFFETPRLVK